MWYAPTITVAAVAEPITLAEAKDQCHVDGSADDTRLTALIKAARAYVESYTGCAIIARTITVKCDGFTDFAAFPIVPLASVSSVSYVDSAGATQTLSTDVYEVRSDGLTASLVLKNGQSWPATQTGARITVTAIVGDSAAGEAVKHAMLLLIEQWYDHRSGISDKPMTEMPHAVTALLCNYRAYA